MVRRDDLAVCQAAEGEALTAAEGQALLRIDSFGMTANNITYAVFGDAMNYWGFFPAPEGWGRIPAWGFATVIESRSPELAEGDRLYGYVPMSDQLLIEPVRADDRVVFDGSAHRQGLPTPYNRYSRVDSDPAYDAAHEDEQILLWPLFYTSFLLDDYLGDQGLFGARATIVSSASSKTAIGAAYQLAERNGQRLIGLTSEANREFVAGLGLYTEVTTYDEIGELETGPVLYVDISGSAPIRRAVHERLAESLVHSCAVGASHWQRFGEQVGELPGPAPAFFFAPDQVAKRSRDWGPDGLEERFTAAWRRFVPWTESWLEVEHGSGFEAIEAAYRQVLDGSVPPQQAHVLSAAS